MPKIRSKTELRSTIPQKKQRRVNIKIKYILILGFWMVSLISILNIGYLSFVSAENA